MIRVEFLSAELTLDQLKQSILIVSLHQENGRQCCFHFGPHEADAIEREPTVLITSDGAETLREKVDIALDIAQNLTLLNMGAQIVHDGQTVEFNRHEISWGKNANDREHLQQIGFRTFDRKKAGLTL